LNASSIRAVVIALVISWSVTASAQQVVSQRGFVEGRGFAFAEKAPNDDVQAIGDLLIREEVFLKPKPWAQFAAGLDLRANSHDQVESEWRLDFSDRSVRRPRAAVRRLTATITASHFTVDIGKQFIRWGRADVLNPTDRFAPRDYLNVIDSEFLPVLGVRPSIQIGKETFEVVVVPRFTPSRLPLFDQRWTALPPDVPSIQVRDGGSIIPAGSEQGVRWNHTGERIEMSLSYFNGFNHLPDIESQVIPTRFPDIERLLGPLAPTIALTRVYPTIRTYGADLAIPTSVLTLKGEVCYFTSPKSTGDEYVLYVIELERQTGEWVLVGGYAGEAVTTSRNAFRFAPDRGIARSFLGRASYTVDPRRTVAIEGAVRQSGDGVYVKGEYSQSFGQHWRLTFTGVGITGKAGDFLGQYNRNSHGSAALRFSF